jgi:1-acyl-sn-glycerol-3-phosphate acyltransferase
MKIMSDTLPRRNSRTGRWLGRLMLRLLGWRIAGELPRLPKAVVVAAPHTSHWDFVFGMAAALTLDLDVRWLGKHSLFRYRPAAWLLTRLGGIPVDRRRPQGIIEKAVAVCNARDRFLLAIAPEGTCRPVARWKSGAWQIARQAGIPLVPIRIDYKHQEIAILEPLQPTGDLEQEMLAVSRLYSAEQAKYPPKFLPHQPKQAAPPPPAADDC